MDYRAVNGQGIGDFVGDYEVRLVITLPSEQGVAQALLLDCSQRGTNFVKCVDGRGDLIVQRRYEGFGQGAAAAAELEDLERLWPIQRLPDVECLPTEQPAE